MNLLALDQSSRVSGYAIFQEDELVQSGTFSVTDEDVSKRLVKIRNYIINLLETYNIDQVAMEDIQMQKQINNVNTHKILAEVLGVCEELCQERHIPHELVHSQSWKSTLKIKGTRREEQKKSAQAYVASTYNKKVSQDESDAICIGTHYIKTHKSAF